MAARRLTIAFLLAVSGPAVATAWTGGDLVTVCHVSPAGPKEIAVSASAAAALLQQHPADTLGACPASVACPCWTGDDLRAALAALPDDPQLGDDPILDRCEASVRDPVAWFSAALVFRNLAGDSGEGALVDFNQVFPQTEQRCLVFIDSPGFGLGLEPVEVMDLSVSEAAACARIVAETCADLLR